MSCVLLAEDNRTQAVLTARLLEAAGFEVVVARDGRAAVERVRAGGIDLVLTDLEMPEMNGLEVVETVRAERPDVPVVLITQHGSEEIAVEALRKGAAGYVPKRHLEREIVPTVDDVLALAASRRDTAAVQRVQVRAEYEFVMASELDLVLPLVNRLQQDLAGRPGADELTVIRVGVALREALVNAVQHGNLEVSSDLKLEDDRAYYRQVEERSRLAPYKDRRVHVLARETPGLVTYVVRDEGAGFDPAAVPDPTDPAYADRAYGRGLLLIRSFMDEVRHNPAGNEITMVKRLGPAPG